MSVSDPTGAQAHFPDWVGGGEFGARPDSPVV